MNTKYNFQKVVFIFPTFPRQFQLRIWIIWLKCVYAYICVQAVAIIVIQICNQDRKEEECGGKGGY